MRGSGWKSSDQLRETLEQMIWGKVQECTPGDRPDLTSERSHIDRFPLLTHPAL